MRLWPVDASLTATVTGSHRGQPVAIAPPWPVESLDDESARLLLGAFPTMVGLTPTVFTPLRTWPVINHLTNASLGASYAPLPRPTTPTRIRYVDTTSGNNANDGLTPATAWRGVKNMVTNATHCPPTGGTRIYVIGNIDLSDSNQYSSGQPNRFVHTLAPGASGNPHEIEPLPGTTSKVIKGSMSLRGANYWRVSGFEFDQSTSPVGDYCLQIEQSTSHFEVSYCQFHHGIDQGLLVGDNTCSDVHEFCNRYHHIGNGVHPSGSPAGFFDHSIYVKNCPRFLSVNAVIHDQVSGYGIQFYDSVAANPAPNARVLHMTCVGNPAMSSSGGIVDDGDGIIVANSIFANHPQASPDTSQSGYSFRWINSSTAGFFRSNIIFGNTRAGVQTGAGATEVGTLTQDPGLLRALSDTFWATETPVAGENWGVLVDHLGRARTSPTIGALH